MSATSVAALVGDEARLYTQLAPRLRRIVAGQVRTSGANVEDACSFAWLQLLRCQPARETLLAWLARTAIREAIKLDRRARRVRSADAADESGSVEGSCPIEARIEWLAACEAIADAGLRPREAALLAARAAGCSYAEIAGAHRTTSRTVERQLSRADRRLRVAREQQTRELETGAPPRVGAVAVVG